MIGNAIKFRGQDDPKINTSAHEEQDIWRFAIKDNGIGIDKNHQKQIFEVFRRLHTRKEYPGTGIGLSICQKIIERHRGKLWVDSNPGKVVHFISPFQKEYPLIKLENADKYNLAFKLLIINTLILMIVVCLRYIFFDKNIN